MVVDICRTWGYIACLVSVLVSIMLFWWRSVGSIMDWSLWNFTGMMRSKAGVGASVKAAEGGVGTVKVWNALGPAVGAFGVRVASMGRLGRYIRAGSLVVLFRFMMPVNLWMPMSGGLILVVNWIMVRMWSWLMVGRFNRLMVGRWPNCSCRLAMVGTSGCLGVQHCFGKRRGVAHTVAVPEVPIIPLSLRSKV